MDLSAMVQVYFEGVLDVAALEVGRSLGVQLTRDDSGRYEEYPAYVADLLGMEIALLGPPAPGESCTSEEMKGFQLLMRTYEEAPDDDVEVDLSAHIAHLLTKRGILCEVVREGEGLPASSC